MSSLLRETVGGWLVGWLAGIELDGSSPGNRIFPLGLSRARLSPFPPSLVRSLVRSLARSYAWPHRPRSLSLSLFPLLRPRLALSRSRASCVPRRVARANSPPRARVCPPSHAVRSPPVPLSPRRDPTARRRTRTVGTGSYVVSRLPPHAGGSSSGCYIARANERADERALSFTLLLNSVLTLRLTSRRGPLENDARMFYRRFSWTLPRARTRLFTSSRHERTLSPRARREITRRS